MAIDVQRMVETFHKKFGIPLEDRLVPPTDEEAVTRLRIHMEEEAELATALAQKNLIEIADALADIVYVAYGTAAVCGIQLDPVITEVHRSNMTKNGKVGPDGKITKGPGYQPPDIKEVLFSQMAGER